MEQLGLPPAQQNEISALTFLALCGLKPDDAWSEAGRKSLGITKGIMAFIDEHYAKRYAPNTRETVRRQVLHQFVQGNIADYNPDDPSLSTNSPHTHYALTRDALIAIHLYRTPGWEAACFRFLRKHGSLRDKYGGKKKNRPLVPVRLPDGQTLQLSPGPHNVVQVAVVEEFLPRFAPEAQLLYLGDAAKKSLHFNKERLQELGLPITKHDKLPDVVFYDASKARLFLVEVVTSHGPMSPKRRYELQRMLSQCKAKTIFVSAFPDFSQFRSHMKNIAWETEVWIVEVPDHMIHFDGEKFLGLA